MAKTPDRFAALLAGSDDALLSGIDLQIDSLGGRELDEGFHLLNRSIRIARDVLLADFAISEGGFSYLFCSDIADLRALPDSYDAIGAIGAARVMREVFAAVSPEVIDSPIESRSERWEENKGAGPWDGLYDFVMAYVQQLPEPDKLIAQFVRDHAAEISELFSQAVIERVQRANGWGS